MVSRVGVFAIAGGNEVVDEMFLYQVQIIPIAGKTLMKFLRVPIKLPISSDCFHVFLSICLCDFSIWSSFSFVVFNFSKTSSYLLSKTSGRRVGR